MSNMFDMMKQAASMKKKMKKIQKELVKQTVEASSGGVTVVACGDMSVRSVKIDTSDANTADTARLEKMIVGAVNNAMAAAKKKAAAEMSSMTGGLGGLADMMGQ
jgi:DNA-binding YbaB/EbfC family protein